MEASRRRPLFPAPKKSLKTSGNKKKVQPAESTAEEDGDAKRAALEALLLGKATPWMLEKLNAASWFSDANKLYGSGQNAFREGMLSPWSMALACEGLAFMAGGVSRRLRSRARSVGAFPFVTWAIAPAVTGEAGRDLAEIWAPVWNRPMTLPEIRTLYERGRAEVRGRGALTPSAFAAAIVRRGVDSGVCEFRRFILGRTTSANTFESHLAGIFCLRTTTEKSTSSWSISAVTAHSAAFERILGLINRLPPDRKVGQRWRFVGLRGPLEDALLQLAAGPTDPGAARAVLDAAVEALDRVDRNRSFREASVSWEPLPIEWLPTLFADEQPPTEARLAMALVSGFPDARPLTIYRFGVEWKYCRFEHPERPPARWTWGPGQLSRVLCALLQRRTLDWESTRTKEKSNETPVRSPDDRNGRRNLSQWLDGTVDDVVLARWISRLALFDWRDGPHEARSLSRPDTCRLVANEDSASSGFSSRSLICGQ